MNYRSSRGTETKDFAEVLINGLAPDGGLYSPISLPGDVDVSHTTIAGALQELFSKFAPGWIDPDVLSGLVAGAYDEFRSDDLCDIKELDQSLAVLDLAQGPTFAFKDFALCLLGPLLDYELANRSDERQAFVVGATSGDTGSAAINGLKRSKFLKVAMLHPTGRVSEIQRRQMTTVESEAVLNLSVDGTFDDCQRLVKQAFVDESLRSDFNLIAVNSINFARVLAQVSYYIVASARLADRGLTNVIVPTGNFGNVLAAWFAKRLGAPIGELVVATNSNDSFVKFLETGALSDAIVNRTLSPSMDIQIPSNLERLLWYVSGMDSEAIADLMHRHSQTGDVAVPDEWMDEIRSQFVADRVTDEETLETIKHTRDEFGLVIDPHTATAMCVAKRRHQLRHSESSTRHPELDSGSVDLVIETAAPDKFLDAVEQALGERPELHPQLAALLAMPERSTSIPATFEALDSAIRGA